MWVLIPFISGLDCYIANSGVHSNKRLNPFYFRAGLLQQTPMKSLRQQSLNPFYFRAGLLRVYARGSDVVLES